MALPGFLRRTRVVVRPNLGNTGDGDTFGDPVEYRGVVAVKRGTGKADHAEAHGLTVEVQLPDSALVQRGDQLEVAGRVAVVDEVMTVPDAPLGSHLDVVARAGP